METKVSFDLGLVAKDLNLPEDKVQRTVELLDEGNTIPFITRYRKDQTGGLDEEQIRLVKEKVALQRTLAERKSTILKSIESQGKLSDKLSKEIRGSRSTKRLEDLYMPFKPKKQSLATQARQHGLEPLANDIIDGSSPDIDLAARATDFVRVDKGVNNVDEVIQGVGYIIAERFSEDAELRSKLRRICWRTGILATNEIVTAKPEARSEPKQSPKKPPKSTPKKDPAAASSKGEAKTGAVSEGKAEKENPTRQKEVGDTAIGDSVSGDSVSGDVDVSEVKSPAVSETLPVEPKAESTTDSTPSETVQSGADAVAPVESSAASDFKAETEDGNSEDSGETKTSNMSAESSSSDHTPLNEEPTPEQPRSTPAEDCQSGDAPAPAPAPAPDAADTSEPKKSAATPGIEVPADASPAAETSPVDAKPATDDAAETSDGKNDDGKTVEDKTDGDKTDGGKTGGAETTVAEVTQVAVPAAVDAPKGSEAKSAKPKKKKKKKKKKKVDSPFKDYFDFKDSISKLPPHRTLAINRGEKENAIRVKFEADNERLIAECYKVLVPEDHPHAEFLKGCARDALNRMLMPSLEREIRRELTERAEQHAVEVFARNLRNLLLQPPICGHRLLCVDPGFRSGCKVAVVDEIGNALENFVFFVVGNDKRISQGKKQLVEAIKKHNVSVVAIGNGTACRETEQLMSDLFSNELASESVSYVIVNEAGASVYSTSSVGREELPDYDPTIRSAISIGRRLLDPLSELVKINAANIGVGLYQHDIKAKHLRQSLDDVVESCVNFVGVDVNTASPSLLGYVSGLNQLTARRLVEYRNEHGPFADREQFRNVPGFGDATFVQSAGFLKINSGENPLDSTWIHPESYQTAEQILERLGAKAIDLVPVEENATTKKKETAADTQPSESEPASVATTEVSEPSQAPESESGTAIGEEVTATEQAVPVVETPNVETPNVETPDVEPSDESPAVEEAAAQSSDEAAKVETAPVVEVEPQAKQLQKEAFEALCQKIESASVETLAEELSQGALLIKDILCVLTKPGRDPREDLPRPIFRQGIMKLDDLEAGTELLGRVLNVVDFGVFVDIGLPDSGLVHISRLSQSFVNDPHKIVSVGDTLRVWVMEIDKVRRRVGLTAIKPGSEKNESGDKGRPRGKRPTKKKTIRRPNKGASQRTDKRPPRKKMEYKPRRPAVPPKPITKDMAAGKKPLRSFSDLKQFYDQSDGDEGGSKKS